MTRIDNKFALTTHAAAVAKVAAINAEYEVEDFAIEYKIDEWQLNT